ncbi:MAG: methyltransferase type 11 [Herpetosiphonaceae bacterium]|nr:MAG: methyltransferase type 11 [Herpetosiphonaceae bacterium]
MAHQQWDPLLYDRKHAFVFEYGRELIGLLDPKPGERILDIGCGTGHLTRAIADAGALVLGIDSSPEMIERARSAYPGLDFQLADARSFALPGSFDAIFSNAALHWIPQADQVAARIAENLKPGGRLVVEMAGRGNVARIIAAVREVLRELVQVEVEHGWYFPSIGEYAGVLERCGLEVRYAALFDRPTRLEDGEQGLRNWLAMFGGRMLDIVPGELREPAIAKAEERLRPALFQQGCWTADYRRLRVVAERAA